MNYFNKRNLSYYIYLTFNNQIKSLEDLYQSSFDENDCKLISDYKKHLRKIRDHFMSSQMKYCRVD